MFDIEWRAVMATSNFSTVQEQTERTRPHPRLAGDGKGSRAFASYPRAALTTLLDELSRVRRRRLNVNILPRTSRRRHPIRVAPIKTASPSNWIQEGMGDSYEAPDWLAAHSAHALAEVGAP